MTFFDDKAYTINDLILAVIAIEDELGTLPAGVYASVRTRLDILEARINNPFAPAPNVNNPFYIGGSPVSGVSIQDGYGDPNQHQILAIPGSLYLREDGYNIQGLYAFRPDGYWHQIDTDPWTACGDLAGTAYCQTVVGIQGRAINPAAPQIDSEGDGYVLTWNAIANGGLGWWEPQIGFFAAGDLSGNKIKQTLVNIQGNKISAANPQDGYALTWNNTSLQWEPQRQAVVFSPLDNGSTTNIQSNRYVTQSPVGTGIFGANNFSSRSTGSTTGVTGSYSAILSGDQNQVSSTYSAIVSGLLNVISATTSVITGGVLNTSSATYSFIGSGADNLAFDGYTSILGGLGNVAHGTYSIVLGGVSNSSGTSASNTQNLVAMGNDNTLTGTSSNSTIVNGTMNTMGNSNFSTILNGSSNTINGNNSAVLSGSSNIINGANSVVLTGSSNTVNSDLVTVHGNSNTLTAANFSTIRGHNNTNSDQYTTADGYNITLALGSAFSTIYGHDNTIGASFHTAIWGSGNTVGNISVHTTSFGSNNTVANSSPYIFINGLSNHAAAASAGFNTIFGQLNTLTGDYSNAFGLNNMISGSYDSAAGQTNMVVGSYTNVFGQGNNMISSYSSATGQNNTVTAASSGYSGAYGLTNAVTADWSNAWGSNISITVPFVNSTSGYANAFGFHHVISSDGYSGPSGAFVHGEYGRAANFGQYTHAANNFGGTTAGVSQFSRLILNGIGASGAIIPLTLDGIDNVNTENGKCYDMEVRILVNSTSNPGICARYVFGVLAHTESNALSIDRVDAVLLNDNGTAWIGNNWTVGLFTNSGTQMVITIPSAAGSNFPSDSRRAVCTVEWRELARN